MSSSNTLPVQFDAVRDLPLKLRMVLGSSSQAAPSLMRLEPGGVVALDPEPGGQVGIFVENKLVARGDVVRNGDGLAIKITAIASD